ncbi:MAG: hypothetical protein HYX72_13125 [Acidobacteria bacterium]|nr:hypothetical protein [Acidobacteriota bacterium]
MTPVSALELPPDLPDRIVNDVGQYCVALFGLCDTITDKPETDTPQVPCGSGVLVSDAGYDFILTADHVWEVLKSREKIGIVLKGGYCIVTETKSISGINLGNRSLGESWGPDLALLLLSADHISNLQAVKRFYELTETKQPATCTGEMVYWLPIGAPKEYCCLTVDDRTSRAHASVQVTGFFVSEPPIRRTKNGFDYCDIKFDAQSSNIPKKFGGMSGGGLWRVVVSKSASNGDYYWESALEGIIFYESHERNGSFFLRSHGLASIRLLYARVL